MATENKKMLTTIEALEDMSTEQYQAVAANDGLVANNAEEATGVLQNKPQINENMTICYVGESKFRAGDAITGGDKLTVTTSGYFITADSNDSVIGEAKATVTSGSIGTGLFSFPTGSDKSNASIESFTVAETFLSGTAIDLSDYKQAASGEAADAVFIGAVNSGSAGNAVVAGIVNGRMDPAQVSSAGDVLTVTGSGYFTPGDSGDYIVAKALTEIGSNSTGKMYFNGIGYYLSV